MGTEIPYNTEMIRKLSKGLVDGIHEYKYEATIEEIMIALIFQACQVLSNPPDRNQAMNMFVPAICNLVDAMDYKGSVDDLLSYFKERSKKVEL